MVHCVDAVYTGFHQKKTLGTTVTFGA